MIKKGLICGYESQADVVPISQVNLKGSTIDKDDKSDKPFTLRLVTAQKKNYYFAASGKEDYNEWICAFKINGCIDGEYMRADQEKRQKEIDEANKKKEKEMKLAEDGEWGYLFFSFIHWALRLYQE